MSANGSRSKGGPADVCLVNMPFVALERPSLALGILKAAGARADVEVHCLNPGFLFAERIGLNAYCRLLDTAPDQNIGDWLFAGAAFPREEDLHAGFLDQLDAPLVATWLKVEQDELRPTLSRLRGEAEWLVEQTARSAVATGARIVGCSSVFQQQGASLALLRAVKELDPSVVTMLGGANCEAQMGVTIHRSFRWIDFVVSGEADLLFPEMCRTILDTPAVELASRPFPEGVLGPGQRKRLEVMGATPPRARVDEMDQCPVPDFTEYFDTLATTSLHDRIHPGLPVETSRGCWWGQKHHCSFCGLNGGQLTYRSKSPERVLTEFAEITSRFGTHRVHVVDNILDRNHLKTVIPALAEAEAPYSIFYETKANVKESELELLADAGVRRVQPGLESLHRGALDLMVKGTTPILNLQFLRWARRLSTFVTWNFLWDVPGDQTSWYGEVADWLPLVFHLQAPNTLAPIRIDRFSPYHQRPEEYGLSLRPKEGLRHIYPVDEATLADLAYYFDDHSRPIEKLIRSVDPVAQRFAGILRDWMAAWGQVRSARPDAPDPPRLEKLRVPSGLEITDTRAVAHVPSIVLDGPLALVLEACDGAPSPPSLARSVDLAERDLEDALETLRKHRLILEIDGRILGLPTAPPRAPYIPVSEYPAGYVLRYDGTGPEPERPQGATSV